MYNIKIDHNFQDLEELARYFADVMTKAEKSRDRPKEQVIGGKGWIININQE